MSSPATSFWMIPVNVHEVVKTKLGAFSFLEPVLDVFVDEAHLVASALAEQLVAQLEQNGIQAQAVETQLRIPASGKDQLAWDGRVLNPSTLPAGDYTGVKVTILDPDAVISSASSFAGSLVQATGAHIGGLVRSMILAKLAPQVDAAGLTVLYVSDPL